MCFHTCPTRYPMLASQPALSHIPAAPPPWAHLTSPPTNHFSTQSSRAMRQMTLPNSSQRTSAWGASKGQPSPINSSTSAAAWSYHETYMSVNSYTTLPTTHSGTLDSTKATSPYGVPTIGPTCTGTLRAHTYHHVPNVS